MSKIMIPLLALISSIAVSYGSSGTKARPSGPSSNADQADRMILRANQVIREADKALATQDEYNIDPNYITWDEYVASERVRTVLSKKFAAIKVRSVAEKAREVGSYKLDEAENILKRLDDLTKARRSFLYPDDNVGALKRRVRSSRVDEALETLIAFSINDRSFEPSEHQYREVAQAMMQDRVDIATDEGRQETEKALALLRDLYWGESPMTGEAFALRLEQPAGQSLSEEFPRLTHAWRPAGKVTSLSLGKEGECYVLIDEKQVRKYNSERDLLFTMDIEECPCWDIATWENGFMLRGKWESPGLLQFDSTATLVRDWDGKVAPVAWTMDQTGNIHFLELSSDASDSKEQEFRVSVFDHDGQLVTEWGRENREPDVVFNPVDMAMDTSGNVFIASERYIPTMRQYLGTFIQKFSPDRNLVLQWGGGGTNANVLKTVTDIEVDSDGNLWVTSPDLGRKSISVYKFDQDGRLLSSWDDFPVERMFFDDTGGINATLGNIVLKYEHR